jgi:hypothetical protein
MHTRTTLLLLAGATALGAALWGSAAPAPRAASTPRSPATSSAAAATRDARTLAGVLPAAATAAIEARHRAARDAELAASAPDAAAYAALVAGARAFAPTAGDRALDEVKR